MNTVSLHSAVRDCVVTAIESREEFSVLAIVRQIRDSCPEIIKRDAPFIVDKFIEGLVKREMAKRPSAVSEDQPLLINFPQILSVQDGEGNPWCVPAIAAKWRHIMQALEARDENVANVTRARDRLKAAARELRPLMEKNPEMTVEEAMRFLKKAA